MRTLIALLALSAALSAPAFAGWKGPTTYRGTPDLQLTSDMLAAGGGPAHFDSKKLVGAMAGAQAPAALAYLTKTYGPQNIDAFFRTFTFAVHDSVSYAVAHQVALPPPQHIAGHALAERLYDAGTLPNGQYDPGYMLEKLVSHPIHMWVMWDINKQPGLGKATDGEFHVILTDAMHKLAGR